MHARLLQQKQRKAVEYVARLAFTALVVLHFPFHFLPRSQSGSCNCWKLHCYCELNEFSGVDQMNMRTSLLSEPPQWSAILLRE